MKSHTYVVRTRKTDHGNSLRVLERTMQKSAVPDNYYSIGSYMEEAICIEKDPSGWIVYEGERGNRYNLKKHDKIQPACYDFFSRVSESDEQENELKDLFLREQRKGQVVHMAPRPMTMMAQTKAYKIEAKSPVLHQKPAVHAEIKKALKRAVLQKKNSGRGYHQMEENSNNN